MFWLGVAVFLMVGWLININDQYCPNVPSAKVVIIYTWYSTYFMCFCICVYVFSYVWGGESNEVVLEVRMPTGWKADKEIMQRLIQFSSLNIKRVDITEDGTAHIFFSKVWFQRNYTG